MIVAYTGVPGSYKTHDAVRQMIDFMVRSKADSVPSGKGDDIQQHPLRHVYTNVRGFAQDEYRVVLAAITGWTDDEISEYVHALSDNEMQEHFGTIGTQGEDKGRVIDCKFQRNAVICVDEVHTLFNCRDFQSDSNRAFTYFGTYHRHENSHVLLITHDIEKVDRQIRDLIGISYYFEQVLFMGKKGKDKYIRYMYRGIDTSGKAVHKVVLSINQGVINSYMTTKSGDVDNFEFVKTPNMLWKSPVLYAIPVVLLLSVFCFYRASSGKGLIGSMMHPTVVSNVTTKGKVTTVLKSPPAPAIASAAAVPPMPPLAAVAPAFKSSSSAKMPEPVTTSGAPSSASGAKKPTGEVVGVMNVGNVFYTIRDNGIMERGSLTKNPNYRVTGVTVNVQDNGFHDVHGGGNGGASSGGFAERIKPGLFRGREERKGKS